MPPAAVVPRLMYDLGMGGLPGLLPGLLRGALLSPTPVLVALLSSSVMSSSSSSSSSSSFAVFLPSAVCGAGYGGILCVVVVYIVVGLWLGKVCLTVCVDDGPILYIKPFVLQEKV